MLNVKWRHSTAALRMNLFVSCSPVLSMTAISIQTGFCAPNIELPTTTLLGFIRDSLLVQLELGFLFAPKIETT